MAPVSWHPQIAGLMRVPEHRIFPTAGRAVHRLTYRLGPGILDAFPEARPATVRMTALQRKRAPP